MNKNLQLKDFVAKQCQERFLSKELGGNFKEILNGVEGKRVLVLGGALTDAGAFIKELLAMAPSALVVVDAFGAGLTALESHLRDCSDVSLPREVAFYAMEPASLAFQKLYLRKGPFDVMVDFTAQAQVYSDRDIFAVEAMLDQQLFRTRKFMDLLALRPPQVYAFAPATSSTKAVDLIQACALLRDEIVLAYKDKVRIIGLDDGLFNSLDLKKIGKILSQVEELLDIPHVEKTDLVNLLALHMDNFVPKETLTVKV